MTPADFYSIVLRPASNAVLSADKNSPEARILLMAIAGQESGWKSRIQVPGGEARGYWQCERGGAVRSVLFDPYTGILARAICLKWDIGYDDTSVFDAIAYHDVLAYAIARLALWQEPSPLPAIGDVDASWQYYLKVWRPGKPRPPDWPAVYAQSVSIVTEGDKQNEKLVA